MQVKSLPNLAFGDRNAFRSRVNPQQQYVDGLRKFLEEPKDVFAPIGKEKIGETQFPKNVSVKTSLENLANGLKAHFEDACLIRIGGSDPQIKPAKTVEGAFARLAEAISGKIITIADSHQSVTRIKVPDLLNLAKKLK